MFQGVQAMSIEKDLSPISHSHLTPHLESDSWQSVTLGDEENQSTGLVNKERPRIGMISVKSLSSASVKDKNTLLIKKFLNL
jgi:hypothetical protein